MSETKHRHGARDLAQMLAGRVDRLAPELLPGGRRSGAEFRAGSIGGQAGQSLAVHLVGHKAGVWSDFAAGIGGDALDLVAQVLYRGDLAAAIIWARRWLGLGDEQDAAPVQRSYVAQLAPHKILGDEQDAEPVQRATPVPARDQARDDGDIERTSFARRLFFEAKADIIGTPVAAYLAARAIDLAKLGRVSKSLRFAPALWCAEARTAMPAMVAAIVQGDGRIIAAHRTYLDHIEGVWRKARLNNPKKTIGPLAGGSIRLWRGASGKAMKDAPGDDRLIITEGIENGLSVALMKPDRRVIACVSVGNLAKIDLPPQICDVTIAADPDRWDSQAAGARQAAIDRLISEGRRVSIARPPAGGDFNDALTAWCAS
ncbi:MAG: hypothetical protein HIU90_07435 [Proteobacteria bacterium]|nr:hypothetical protein [Pseudomonadota bacterium]